MSIPKNKKESSRKRVKKHIRKKLSGTAERPRLVVFKSSKHIYAQLVDDTNQKTITGVSSLTKDVKAEVEKAGSKTEAAKIIGKKIAAVGKDKKVESVVFDRNGYLYHGRIKAVADGAREGGLKF
ncbi:50S ribosomal protein L18 [candidate division KSB1 bacterium]|nr:50S ribosomal protein L18 [candidate division KSB1 bacterium]